MSYIANVLSYIGSVLPLLIARAMRNFVVALGPVRFKRLILDYLFVKFFVEVGCAILEINQVVLNARVIHVVQRLSYKR